MASILLVIIYISFISLGLPDSILGAAWPVIHLDLGVPLSYAGFISMVIAAGTVASSLMSDWLTKKFGTGLVTAISVGITAGAMLGFSLSTSFAALCILAVPYGLGAGAVDAALNNFVALHYSSRHMNWLHCFWGVGTVISPNIMGYFLLHNAGWNNGYLAVAVMQAVLTLGLFISLPLWRKARREEQVAEHGHPVAHSLPSILKIPGVKFVLPAFFGYCAIEQTTILWASSYLVENRGVGSETAAWFASLFFIGITAGRFVCGFVADKVGDKNMIRLGQCGILLGTIFVCLPVSIALPALLGFIFIGLGCAPVYPSIIHATPFNFGSENSQAVIGMQMASAYLGTAFIPPIFGLVAEKISIALLPYFLLFLLLVLVSMTELLNKVVRQNCHGEPRHA